MRPKFIWFMLVGCLAFAPTIGIAADRQDATNSAKLILAKIQDGDYEVVWDSYVSQFFKSQVATKESFLSNMALSRSQLGNVLEPSKIVDVSYTTEDPTTHTRGEIYAINFSSLYHAGRFYERIVVIKERDNQFRLSGIWGAPAQSKNQ